MSISQAPSGRCVAASQELFFEMLRQPAFQGAALRFGPLDLCQVEETVLAFGQGLW